LQVLFAMERDLLRSHLAILDIDLVTACEQAREGNG
jgi:hypothetical protein